MWATVLLFGVYQVQCMAYTFHLAYLFKEAVLTINVPVVYVVRDVMILMEENPNLRTIGSSRP
jgi:hypothetical protein